MDSTAATARTSGRGYTPEHYEQNDDAQASDDGSESESDDDLMQDISETCTPLIVKIPKHLLERWSAIDEEGVHLATIRVYDAPASAAAGPSSAPAKPRGVLMLPPDPDDERLGRDEYDMDFLDERPSAPYNEYVFASRAPAPGAPSKAAKHKASSSRASGGGARGRVLGRPARRFALRAQLTDRLCQRVKDARVRADAPKRQTVYLGHTARSRSLATAAAATGAAQKPFLLTNGSKPAAKGPADKMARAPRPKVLDMLFTLFNEQAQWPLKALRERTQQPEAYLRELLSEIAFQHRTGEHRGDWELSADYSDAKRAASPKSIASSSASPQDPLSLQGEEDQQDESTDGDDESDMEQLM
ncbi:transcription initiation factor IIF, beta subunit-domain-containing protein [Trametes elegans]|nr:transcription initiation factor IIF, beta subunit-domain-containing protein [Trametes elegans]